MGPMYSGAKAKGVPRSYSKVVQRGIRNNEFEAVCPSGVSSTWLWGLKWVCDRVWKLCAS